MRYSWHGVLDMLLWCDYVLWYDTVILVLEFWYFATLVVLIHCDLAVSDSMTYCSFISMCNIIIFGICDGM